MLLRRIEHMLFVYVFMCFIYVFCDGLKTIHLFNLEPSFKGRINDTTINLCFIQVYQTQGFSTHANVHTFNSESRALPNVSHSVGSAGNSG